MQVVILAAGKGTRMRPLTDNRPKPMLPVADRPLCAHTADAAVDAGATELIFVIGYEADHVKSYFGEQYRGVPVSYGNQEEQRGTAHAVRAVADRLDGAFAVLNGDDLYAPAGIAELLDGAPAVGTYEVDSPSEYGVFDIEGDRIDGIVEKPVDPPSNLINVGAYAFPAAAKNWLDVPVSERGEHELTDVLARTIAECNVQAVRMDRWLGVGRPWELLAANEWKLGLLERELRGKVAADAQLRGRVIIEEGATIEPGVVIEGPTLVRSGASVGPNAFIRGATLLCENVHVGHAVEVKNSVIMAGTNVPHLSYVGDSVLGRDVNLGAGTTVANLRHDGEPVEFTVKGQRVSTGRRKFGIVAGDGTRTGIDTSVDAGVCLSTDARTGPGETITRDR
ncbi:MAG: bifunctional sugar-1-phosphate nucleotidylyltransferase/acetyltransferase [Salinirussus sp.]